MKQLDYILANETEVLHFLKSKYPLYHLSNFFFRDIQYGIQTMLDWKNMSVGYSDAEMIARAYVAQLEKKKILNPIDRQSWVVNYPEFKKPTVTPAAPAKPAAKPAAPAAPAAGGAKPSLPPLSRPAAGAPKPGGLPPLSRPAAGATATAKPGGLPPLKSVASAMPKPSTSQPVAQPHGETPTAVEAAPVVEALKQATTAPPPAPVPKPVVPGGKNPCRHSGVQLPLGKSEQLNCESDKQEIMNTETNDIEELANREYKYGFVTDIESDTAPRGLNEETVRFIAAKKNEPEWLIEWRLKAYRHWLTMEEPVWPNVHYPKIDYQDMIYYSAPKRKDRPKSINEVDPELRKTYEKLGISLAEQERLSGVAVDAVFDSVSVATTFKEKLGELGIIFCSFSEAVKEHPELVKKYLGSVVPSSDNFFAALNSAVFSDGSFCFIPKGVRCPMELSTYFRINAAETGQFERTLIVAEEGAYVSYLEGCTAPMRDTNQLHAAVVELIALDNAQIKYSTVQNWYPGDKGGKGGIYNFVTKRGKCAGVNAKISWTQVETGSAITWKYPSCILLGDNSVGEFYSVAVANNYQQADTGTKMIHIGKNTRSTVVSKGISAGHGNNSYRGLIEIKKNAVNARNFSQCDSLLLGDQCGAHTFPYIEVKNSTAKVEHEASTSKIGEDQIFYCKQRGLSTEDAVNMIVNGFCKEVFRELPMEFAVEAQKLLGVSLEGSVG